MRDFIISTETNCDLSQSFIKENNICVIPHYYTVEEDDYGDGKLVAYSKVRGRNKSIQTLAAMMEDYLGDHR